MNCPFCSEAINARAVAAQGAVFAVEDLHPVTRGHLLVIPRRHREDDFSMTRAEVEDADRLLRLLRKRLLQEDPTISGFNIGMNCGLSAGQEIFHAHIHLIPRRAGDTPHPLGGVRGVIPGRMAPFSINQ